LLDRKISVLVAALVGALGGCASGTSHPAAIESRTAARVEPKVSPPVQVAPPADAPANEPRVQALPDNQSPASMAVALPTPPVAGSNLDASPAGSEKHSTAGVQPAK
jgi:hypothetical protein